MKSLLPGFPERVVTRALDCGCAAGGGRVAVAEFVRWLFQSSSERVTSTKHGEDSSGHVVPFLIDRERKNADAFNLPQGAEIFYPMHVIPVMALLTLDKFEPHQTLVQRGVVKPITTECFGRIIFISHEWTGRTHPDPEREQFAALIRVLTRLMEGKTSIESSWMQQMAYGTNRVVTADAWVAALRYMYVWFDYFSIPQLLALARRNSSDHRLGAAASSASPDLDNLKLAVDSIPAYVEHCELFLVLVPICWHWDRHEPCNFQTWRSRGWCRVEFQAALFASADVPVMICIGAEADPFFSLAVDAWKLVAGRGVYTCCQVNHFMNGLGIACDKTKIAPVLATLLESKTRLLRESGKRQQERHLLCMRQWLLYGLVSHRPTDLDEASHVNALEGLKSSLNWCSEDSENCEADGRTLLHYAVLSDSAEAVGLLLDSGTFGVNLPVIDAAKERGEYPGSPLLYAMAFASFNIVEQLLLARADPRAKKVATNDRALLQAAVFGRLDNVSSWFTRFPESPYERSSTGDLPISSAMGLAPENLISMAQCLLSARSDPNDRGIGATTMLHHALLNDDGGQAELIRILIESGCDVNAKATPTVPAIKAFHDKAYEAVQANPRIGGMLGAVARGSENTPLHTACQNGKVAAIKVLLDTRADPSIRNRLGHTALEAARYRYGEAVPAVIEDLFDSRRSGRL